MPSSDYAPLADESNPPFSRTTPGARVTRSGTITYRQEDSQGDHGDLGEPPRFTTQEKGKSRAGGWDIEQGYAVLEDEAPRSYPPLSTEEEEERRIQANLARLAARDQAEKRARQSRIFNRPLSIRMNYAARDPHCGTLPTTGRTSSSSDSLTTPTSPANLLPAIKESIYPDPTTPTNDATSINPFDTPFERIHRSSSSINGDPNSPEPAFGYAGPEWRGGAGQGAEAQGGEQSHRDARDPSRLRRVLPDKWWKALCAWGADLDGGHEDQADGGQAGRTNPFE